MTSLRWLHLSDLHQGMRGQESLWPNVKEAFYDDLAQLSKSAGPWDIVFFTGDLTQRGSTEEFAEVTAKLQDLRTYLRSLGSTPIFLPVPGNHDLVRPDPKNPVVKAMANWDTDTDVSEGFWSDHQSWYQQVVDAAFANYREWLEKGDLPRPALFRSGLLAGDFVTTIEKDSLRIGVIGLNSAYLQLTGMDHKGKLALRIQQILDACDGDPAAWARKHHLCIVLTHHPVDWLSLLSQEHFRTEIAPPGRFAIHLVGHMHEGRSETVQVSGASESRSWQGYSLFGIEGWGTAKQERTHGYMAGVLEFQQEFANACIYPRVMITGHGGLRHLAPDHRFKLLGECTRPEQILLHRPVTSPIMPERTAERHSSTNVHDDHSQAPLHPGGLASPDVFVNRAIRTLSERPVPVPRFVDDETRVHLNKLEELRKRKQEFIDKGWEIEAIDAEIRKEKYQLRKGGQLRAGDTLGERYKLINPIGDGGYGVVWNAYDLHTTENVAVKVLHSNVAGDGIRLARFFRGAETMEKLKHAAVVEVIQKWGEDDGFYYYAMKKYAGGNLAEAVHRGISDEQVLQIVIKIADALSAAHAWQWVHRDVKPANILLDENGNPYLGDFELVAMDDTSGGTRKDEILGTFFFSAPEVLENPLNADVRADVYSLGMTLLNCLNGGTKKTPESAIRSLACAESVKEVIRRSLKRKPSDRFANAGVFRDALRSALQSENVAIARPRTSKSKLVECVSIPGSTFRMGADGDNGGRVWERPVTLSPYELSVNPITRRIYSKVLGRPIPRRDADVPIEMTWIEALRFCNELSQQEELEQAYFIDEARLTLTLSADAFHWNRDANGYRLPTEAEWEFAARGTDERVFPWGNDDPTSQLHWSGYGPTRSEPSRINQYPGGASPFGIHDMSGNIWEWCWDCHGPRYHSSDPLIIDPAGPSGAHQRIVRGGDWQMSISTLIDAPARTQFDG